MNNLYLVGKPSSNKIYNTMNYNFFLKAYVDKRGYSPIYLNITVGGERKRMPTGVDVPPKFWNKDKQAVLKSFEEAENINLAIKNIESRLTKIQIFHTLNESPMTLTKVIEDLLDPSPDFDFIKFFKHQITLQESCQRTIIKHNTILNKLIEFKKEILFVDLNLELIDKFRAFLFKVKGNSPVTINSNIAIIKKYIRLAHRYDIKTAVNLDDVKIGSTSGTKTNLSLNEVQKMLDYYFSPMIKHSHKLCLGYFLFGCYTGLRISDIQGLKREDLQDETFSFISQKTKKQQTLTIINTTRKILEEYPKLFVEFFADQTLNDLLKEIATFLGIKKRVSTHVARHTFATNYLRKGGKVEDLQVLLGHTKITNTMVYVHIVNEEASASMFILD